MIGTRLVILLVEDDDLLRDAITRQLKARGYAVVPLANVRDAAEVLTFIRPAAIIMDYSLPDSFATELLDGEMSASKLGAPIVMISGFAEARSAAAKRGIPFVNKPFEMEELLAAFEPLMAGAQSS